MRKIILSLAGVFFAGIVSASVIDAPHNEANNMTCSTCHSYSLWWQYSPSTRSLLPSHATVVNTVCMECHDNGSLLGVRTHSAAVISSTNNYHQGTDGWGVGCTDCHNPHYQEQLAWGPEAFLVEGTIDRTAPNNGITHGTVVIGCEEYDQTTIAIAAGLTEKDPDNWPLANWTKKTGVQGRGLILSQDTTVNANTFTVLAATATEIVVKGKLDATAVIPDFDSDGPGPQPANSHAADTFGLAYGQLLKKAVVVPFTDPDGVGSLAGESRAVKFVNPIGGFVDTVNTPATGICQVCHTLTADHADPENPLPRFRNSGLPTSATDSHADYANGTTFGGTSTCTICHTHLAGFKGAGHGKEDFGWASISYTKADGSRVTVNCAGCHDGSKSVIAIHGYQCALCHVKPGGGRELRVAGSAGSDAVNIVNGIDGDPSGATRSATCATCHDKAARPNIENSPPQIHHAASPHNYAANNACTVCHKSAAMAATAHTTAADHASAIGLAVTTGVPGAVVNGCDACHQPDATTGIDYSTHGTGTGAITDSDPSVLDNPRVHDRCVSCHKTDGGLKDFTRLTPAGIELVVAGYRPGHGAGFLPNLDQATNCLSCHGTDPGLTHLKHSHALTVGNTPQCNWCHVDQIGLNNGAKTDPNNDMVHDACTTCHTISKGLVGDYTVGLVDPLDLTRYPPLVDKIETPLHKGSAVVCTDCHGIHMFADHQHADHTPVVMTSSEGCTDSCHIDTDGNGPPIFGMNLDPLNNTLHDECTSCHDTADGNLKSVAEVDRPYVVAMPDGEALPNMPNDGGGECSACHGGAYFARHRAIDHTTRVAASALCSPCHPAATIAGTTTGIPVDPDNNKVHDACTTCHEVTGELKGAYGRASSMPAGGGTCSDCHGDYRDDHNHDHSTLVRVNTATTPVIANCVGCHGASSAPFAGPGEVHNRLGCRFCHSATDFALIGSAAGKTGGGECITCHGTHFTGHSHAHLVMIQANDLAQEAPTACAVCHNDAGEGLATWSAILTEHRSSCATCHNATRLTGNPDAPTETVQNVIAANADPTACLACHWGKKSPATHGHVATDFTWAGTCSSCHSGEDIIADVHGGQCTLCHVDPATGNYTRKAGTDGDATLAGLSNTASCIVCHDPAVFPDGRIHHNDTASGIHAMKHLNDLGRTCSNCHGDYRPPLMADGLSLALTATCASCHTNGAAGGAPNKTDYKEGWNTLAYSLGCTDCHNSPPDYIPQPKANSHSRHQGFTCNYCHSAVTHDGTSIADTSQHTNADYTVDPDVASGVTFTYAYAVTGGTCATISCHGNNQATWGGASLTCQSCHLGAVDVDDFGGTFTNNGLTSRIAATDEWSTTGHGRPAASGNYPSGNVAADFIVTNACLYCHDSTITHQTGANPFRLRNIADATWGKNGVCQSCHAVDSAGVTVDATPKNGLVKIGSGHYGAKHAPANNGGQFCWDCHDAHGDGNRYMIQAAVAKTSDVTTGAPTSTVATEFIASATGSDYAKTSAPYTGICQVCHSTTTYYNPSANGHYTERCTNCHTHSATPGFAHGGGGGAGCGTATACHGLQKSHPTHVSGQILQLDCAECHDPAIFPKFKDGATSKAATTVCDNCHTPDGAAKAKQYFSSPGSSIGTSGSWLAVEGEKSFCGSCHNSAPGNSKGDGLGDPAFNVLGNDTTYGFSVIGHGKQTGNYAKLSHQDTSAVGNPAAARECSSCHNFTTQHFNNANSRLKTGYENDQNNNNCSQCHTPGGSATANPQFYASSADFESSAHASKLCTECHNVHGVVSAGTVGTSAAMTQSAKESLCYQCHTEGVVQNDAISETALANDIEQAFSLSTKHDLGTPFTSNGKSYTLECDSCHNPHVVTGKFSEAAEGKSPVTRFINNTEVWGIASGEKMSDYAPPGLYQTPAGDTLTGEQLPDYPTLCTDCHNDINTIYSPSLGRELHKFDWRQEKHGGYVATDNTSVTELAGPYQDSQLGNYVLSCTDCHEAHGSSNQNSIRTKVNGTAVAFSFSDVKWLCYACHDNIASSHHYIEPECTTCHAHSVSCVTCHYHGANSTDGVSPVASNMTPANTSNNVPLDANITLTLSDNLSGNEWSSFQVTLAGNKGYSKTYTAADASVVARTGTLSGYNVTVNPDADFMDGEIITVTVTAHDREGNALVSPAWSFTSLLPADIAPPAITNRNPANGVSNVAVNDNLTFTLEDGYSGIDWDTFSITLTGTMGYSRNYTGASPQVAKTGNPASYNVTVNPDTDFGNGEVITAVVHVSDLAGNALVPPEWSITTTPGSCGPPGALDTSFGSNGKATAVLTSSNDYQWAVAIQPDGKIVGVGNASSDFAVIRYNTNGSLDIGFGSGGTVVTPIGSGTDRATAVEVQTDGKIVAAGYATVGGNYDFAVARYNTDGSLDTTFGSNGIVTTPIGTTDYARGVAIQADGKIVVAGYAYTSSYDFAVVRYNTDGSLDTGFGSGGKVITPIGTSGDYGRAIAIQSDGKILVAGTASGTPTALAVVRYNTDGSLDASFGSNGIAITGSAIGANGVTSKDTALALQADGKIVVLGVSYSLYDFVTVRYNTDGSLDTSFDGDGIVISASGGGQIDSYCGVKIQTDGKIVAVSDYTNGTNLDFIVIRYNTNGSLDTSFDGDGKVTTAVDSYNDYATGVAIQADGKIVVVGDSYLNGGSTEDFVVVRYCP